LVLLLGGQPSFQWDVPGVLSEIDVPVLMETDGIPNRFHVVISSLPAEELLAHFARAFHLAGLHLPRPERQTRLDGQLMLTGFDPRTETSYSVILQPWPNGHTGVVLGEAYFAGRTLGPLPATFAPVFPGAEHLVTARLGEAWQLGYSVRASAEEVLTFYAQTLVPLGYTAGEDGTFDRGSESIRVMVGAMKGRPTTQVTVLKVRLFPSPCPGRGC
jgi:hypothetical protein